MPHPAPQRSTPETPRKPPPPPDAAPSEPPTSPPEPSPEGALFRALVDAGAEAVVAYTADRQARVMASEIAAAQIQPVLAELRQWRKEIRENMATKADLANTETRMRAELAELRAELLKWTFAALMAQAALVVALIKLLP